MVAGIAECEQLLHILSLKFLTSGIDNRVCLTYEKTNCLHNAQLALSRCM
jgi:hypothetical protein